MPTPKARKSRTGSVKAQTELQSRLETKVQSPLPLSEIETEVFNGLIDGLPQESWETHRIRIAANVAKIIAYQESLVVQVIEEGPIIFNDKGTPVSNPKQAAMASNASTIKQTLSLLGLTASQRGISATSTRAQKEAEKTAKKAISSASGGGLLA